MRATISIGSPGGPALALMPMQPNPSADTSSPLIPSVRVLMSVSCASRAPSEAGILVVTHLLHPVDDLAVQCFLNRDVSHRGCGLGAMPMLLARRRPDHVTRPDLLD